MPQNGVDASWFSVLGRLLAIDLPTLQFFSNLSSWTKYTTICSGYQWMILKDLFRSASIRVLRLFCPVVRGNCDQSLAIQIWIEDKSAEKSPNEKDHGWHGWKLPKTTMSSRQESKETTKQDYFVHVSSSPLYSLINWCLGLWYPFNSLLVSRLRCCLPLYQEKWLPSNRHNLQAEDPRQSVTHHTEIFNINHSS